MRADRRDSPLDNHLATLETAFGAGVAALEAALDALLRESSLPADEAAKVLSARASAIWATGEVDPSRMSAIYGALAQADNRWLACGARVAVHGRGLAIEGPDLPEDWPAARGGRTWWMVEQPADEDGRVRRMDTCESRLLLTLALRPWLTRSPSPVRTIYSTPETDPPRIIAQTLPSDGGGGGPVLQVLEEVLPILEDIAPGITSFVPRGSARVGRGGLTPRELDVLDLLARGYSNKEVSRLLGCGVRTVETHRLNFRRKVGAGRLHEIVLMAGQHYVGPGYPPRCPLPGV